MDEKFRESEEVRKPEVVEESIWVAGEAVKKAPKMYGVPTGVEGLDELFFTAEIQEGKVIKKPLGGIPAYSVTNITGVAVSHIVDCSMVLSKEPILTQAQSKMYKKPVGEIVRLFRIDGCRLCGHDTNTHFMEITQLGLVKIGPVLSVG